MIVELFAKPIEKINTSNIQNVFLFQLIFMYCYLPARPLFHSFIDIAFRPLRTRVIFLCLYFTIELFIFTTHSLLPSTANVSHVPFVFSIFSPVAKLRSLQGVADFIRLMGIVSS